MTRRRVAVLLPMPVESAFDYLAPEPAPPPGSLVRVPLGRRIVVGVVQDEDSAVVGAQRPPDDRLKDIAGPVDLPAMAPAMRRFIERVAGYTLAPAGMVLRMALPVQILAAPEPVRVAWRVTGKAPARRTPARDKVLALLADGRARPGAEIRRACGVSSGVVRALAAEGVLEAIECRRDPALASPDPEHPGPELSADQAAAADSLRAAVGQGGYAPFLLEGATGSGKTEIYFEAIAAALRRPVGQILVLLPEIALAGQWLERFERRFGVRPTEWHSGLGLAGRRSAWHRIARGEARVVVGARSSLFLPFAALSLVIVDEEHDPSFKQEEGVIYHARDMAVLRASLEEVPIVLCSATPSLETLANVARGRYRRILAGERYGAAGMPVVEAIDLRRMPPEPGAWIAPPLVAAVDEALVRGEQTLLFLNRRGYAPVTLCRACGARLECPDCTAWLVEHRARGRVECHHCGYARRLPETCPACAAQGTLVPCGPGVERLAEETARRWPTARLALMSSDSTGSAAAMRELVGAIEAGRVDIVIGTQIITKGYHFPRLTVVGVIDADLGLRGGDLRAGERTWQQLMQVAGRAGRAEHAGRVFLQTHDPEHPVTAALVAGDAEGFLLREGEERRRAGMPPFGRLAAILLSGRDLAEVEAAAVRLARQIPAHPEIRVFGPAPAPLARLRGAHRLRFLVKATRRAALQDFVRAWTGRVGLPRAVDLRVDIDPQSFL